MNKTRTTFFLLSVLLIIFITISCTDIKHIINSDPTTFFISPKGNDDNIGSKNKPFATLEGARNAIRKLKNSPNFKSQKITVYLREGCYYRNETFKLESVDSGDVQFPIEYRAYKDEKVTVTGGIELDKSKFTKISDSKVLSMIIDKNAANNILQYDLKTNGIYYSNINENINDAPKLTFNNEALTLARWPNKSYLSTGKILSNSPAMFTFEYNEPRPILWNNKNDMWLFGYWYHNWSDLTVKVKNLNTNLKSIQSDQNSPFGIRSEQRYYVFNLLEELDAPGEWYVDREKGLLYLYPPSSINSAIIQLSQLNKPFIELNNTSNIKISGLTFESGRDVCLVINNGTNNLIDNCTIRNISKNAVSLNNGFDNGVENCEIYNMGAGGIIINAGDRNTLTSSNNFATNNRIYNYSQIKATYSAAISLTGVGNIASHNEIHDAPHTAILFHGNEHIIQYNEIYNVGSDTDDVAAIYTGRDWTYRGNIIRYNFIHHLKSPVEKIGVMGINLDDCMSSAEVTGNVFFKVSLAICAGGGSNHQIKDNIAIDCNRFLNFDERGLTWDLTELYNNLNFIPYESEIWQKQYPDLYLLIQNNKAGTPVDNIVENNILFRTPNMWIADSIEQYGLVRNNINIETDPGFVDLENMNFTLTRDSIIYRLVNNFNPIPFKNIGNIDLKNLIE